MYNAVFEARAKWRRIGLELDITSGTLDAIDQRFSNPTDRLEQVLSSWLSKGSATWKQLVEALFSVPVGETQLSKQIQKKYCHQGISLLINRQ